MHINDPSIVVELTAIYPQYEAALVANDIETMQRLFWASPYVVRYGATENLYGIDEIEAFRRSRPASNLARTVTRLEISTFGKDLACIHVEFERAHNAGLVRGRQSQCWVRLEEGWRIVAAHVSTLP